MRPHYLNELFAPRSVAMFGASDRTDSVGRIVFGNLINGVSRARFTPSTLADNHRMLEMVRKIGLHIQMAADDPSIRGVSKNL